MKNIKFLLPFLFGVAITFSGCAAKGKLRYDVETQRQQLIEEIDHTATVFNLPLEKAGVALLRTKMFFDQYLNERYYITNDAFMNKGSGGKYTYIVRRKILENGETMFSVLCNRNRADATDEKALRNAKNVARFIHFGTLELSLLDR